MSAARTREVLSSIGAGDTLFSAVFHFCGRSENAYTVIRKAVVLASYRIGKTGSGEGLLDEESLNDLPKESEVV